jgi:MFS family permease
MGGMIASNTRAVGAGLAGVLPNDGIPWYRKGYLVRLNFSIVSLILFSSANGYDGSMMNGLQALDQWQEFMNHPTGAWLGFINAAQSLGAFFVYPLVAWICARFGRKVGVGGGYIWLLLGTGLQTGARSPAMFVLGRLFLGGVTAHFAVSVPCLITEIAYPTHRGIITALYNTGWYVGKSQRSSRPMNIN